MLMAMLLIQALAGAAPPAAPKVDWIRKPLGRALDECMGPLRSGGLETSIRMQCLTAPNDHIDHCTVLENSHAPDARYEQVALCMSRFFKIRATGPDGKPVTGVVVNIPYLVTSPEGAQELRHKPPNRVVFASSAARDPRYASLGPVGPYYPARAADLGLNGAATLLCTVEAHGGLEDCKVLSEQPARAGFSEAALRMAERRWILAPPPYQAGAVVTVLVPFEIVKP
jgi:TonB family protein